MPGMFSKMVARRIRERRGKRSQRVFAEQTGSRQQTVSKYEREEIPESWEWLANLREIEGVDLNEFLSRKSDGGNGR